MFFLAPDSPGPAAHKTAPVQECVVPGWLTLLLAVAEMPLLRALDILFASAKAHSLPDHILDRSEQGAVVPWRSAARSPVSTRGCGFVFASFFSLSVSSVRFFGEVDFDLCPVKWVQSKHCASVTSVFRVFRQRMQTSLPVSVSHLFSPRTSDERIGSEADRE